MIGSFSNSQQRSASSMPIRVSLETVMSGGGDDVQDCLVSVRASQLGLATTDALSGADAEKLRLPADICVVIDVSGSMGEESTVQDANGETKRFGLSLLVRDATPCDGSNLAQRGLLATCSPGP